MQRYGGMVGMPKTEQIETVTSAAEFLALFKLHSLMPSFHQYGVASVNDLLLITPSALEEMGVTAVGVRNRLISALQLLREAHRTSDNEGAGGSSMDIAESESTAASMGRQANSTSSLFIESTIAHPDLQQICFCVSILVHDLIMKGEEDWSTSPAAYYGAGQAFALIKPRDIFALPGKRSRHEFETETPDERQVPTEEDIRFCLGEVHKLTRFSPGCLVVAMIYIERLRRKVGTELLTSTWQLTLLTSIILAQKMWEDQPVTNVDFTSLDASLTSPQLHMIEREFLRMLDYHFTISAAIYTEWYFKLCELCERKSIRMRPLNHTEATQLEINTHLFTTKVQSTHNSSVSGPIEGANQRFGRAVIG